MKNRLAFDGGTPVRAKPLPAPYLGSSVMGKEELKLLTEVVTKRLPFRAYGAGVPHMVNDFEKEARRYFGVKHALATATGSGSFYCAMAGLGIGPGDEVIIPSFGWFTDFEAPVLLGALPVFADIDRSLNMDPADFERKITRRTKAVIVIHFQGATNDMDRLCRVARKRGIQVVEDCAQACGSIYQGRKVGSLGDVACFSFQQNKILSTGDGGLLLAKDPLVFERAVRFHDLGIFRSLFETQIGGKPKSQAFSGCQFRMNEFTGAVALAQLRKLDPRIIRVTRKYFRRLKQRLRMACPGMKFRQTGDDPGDAGIAFYMDLGTPERGEWFGKALSAEGIRIGPSSGCCNLLKQDFIQHKRLAHPALPPFGPRWPGARIHYLPRMAPNTDRILASMVCIALSPALTSSDVNDMVEAVVKVWRGRPKRLFESIK